MFKYGELFYVQLAHLNVKVKYRTVRVKTWQLGVWKQCETRRSLFVHCKVTFIHLCCYFFLEFGISITWYITFCEPCIVTHMHERDQQDAHFFSLIPIKLSSTCFKQITVHHQEVISVHATHSILPRICWVSSR